MKLNTYKAVAYNVHCYKQFCVAERFVEFYVWSLGKEDFTPSDNLITHFKIQFENHFNLNFNNLDKLTMFQLMYETASDFVHYLEENNYRLFDRFLHYYLSMKQKSKRTRHIINYMLDYIKEYTSFYGKNDLQVVFLTFTFNDKYLAKLDNVTKRRYVTSYLNNDKVIDYLGNIDYGSKNERIHFHVLALTNGKIDYTTWKYGTINGIKANIVNGALGGYIDKLSNHELKVKILENASKKNGKQYNVYKLRCRNQKYDKTISDIVGKDITEVLEIVKTDSLPFADDLKNGVQENVQRNLLDNNSYVPNLAHNLEEELPF